MQLALVSALSKVINAVLWVVCWPADRTCLDSRLASLQMPQMARPEIRSHGHFSTRYDAQLLHISSNQKMHVCLFGLQWVIEAAADYFC